MKRSLQEIAELVVFGLIALLVGTGLIWLLGGLFNVLGIVFFWLAGVLWYLLRFIIPIALVLGVVFFLVRLVVNPRKKTVTATEPQAGAPLESAAESVKDAAENAAETVKEAADTAGEKVANAVSDGDAEPETRADDAEPVDTSVDTSGYKEMDDEAEALEDEADDKKS